ncbi:DNA excision repair protein ERCC-6-like 2, partial [Dissostichus eleginoides]
DRAKTSLNAEQNSEDSHGPCLVKAARTRRGLSLKVIKKRTCWLGEKPAIGFLRALKRSDCAGKGRSCSPPAANVIPC